nr:thioredoxin domain-containing protein [Nitrospinaceae bacterium]NIR55797.1 thioredoxin domain-containing protein [Nitrospinaceae bacterium]NIS86250.1 thioredoxin domain-containing protein [Nitrospinaceae bacterium]NIT83079.1 thioredoxin domain-containing protein [Nitrospinaceae bacterium]NIU45289.1 thioredoxin domain-containing protein [Nitrospinaceae bacterium]
NVLQVRDSVERISEEENIPIFEVPHLLKKAKKILFDAREKREKPARDEKIITAWNGLMITALATGYCVLRDPSCLDTARRAGEFLWTRQWRDDRLQRIHKDGQSKIDGCLEDYACFLEALLALYEASLDSVWMDRAVQTADRMIEEFWDASEGGFFLTGVSQEPLILRLKSAADEAVPSANAIAALALTRLAHGTGNFDYLKKAEKTVRAFQGALERSPAAFKGLLGVVDFLRTPPTEVVFAGPRDDARFEELQRVLYQDFRPNKIVLWRENEETERRLPLAEGRTALQGKPTVYLCQNQTCHPPVQSGEGLGRLLERPPEIRINIYDAEKHRVEIESQQQQDFLSAMDRIFKQSGLKGKK